MKISNHAIDHPRFVYTVTALVLLLALYAAISIPVQRTPAITNAVVLVAIPYPDAQPSEAENEIARKVEEVLSELTPRQSHILRLRFGLGGGEPHTLEEIAKQGQGEDSKP